MPFCCQCGTQVTDADQYCAKCGGRQAGARAGTDLAAGFSPRTASILCYIPWVGWIAAIVVLASSTFRNNRTVRFHAFQGLYLFVAGLIVKWVFTPFTFIGRGPHFHLAGLLELAILALWIFMIVKTSQEQVVSLPVIGELAEKSLSE
jgi:uncharacterized membrane protein